MTEQTINPISQSDIFKNETINFSRPKKKEKKKNNVILTVYTSIIVS